MSHKLTIQALRVRRGVTQGTLAVAAETSQPVISMIENGSYIPSDELLEKIASALKVKDPLDLLLPIVDFDAKNE